MEHWTYTPVKTTHINYTWIINNFLSQSQSLVSPKFSTTPSGCKYCLILDTHQISHTNEHGYYSLKLSVPTSELSMTIKSTCSIIDSNARKISTVDIIWEAATSPSQIFMIKRDIMKNKERILPNNQLTILCEMTVIEEGQQKSKCRPIKAIRIPESKIVDVFEDIWKNKRYCDVEFIVGLEGEKIKAHKAILVARSSVFRATFENNMQENKTNQVIVNNFTPEVFNGMLQFIYSDRIDHLDDMATDLFIIANYYDLERLKVMCEDFLYRTLTIENAAEILTLADVHNARALKLYTRSFIETYGKEFTKTAGFTLMQEAHPELGNETLRMLANTQTIRLKLSPLDDFLFNDQMSDVVLTIGEKRLPAHKLVLGAQSSVFADIFKASTSRELAISDIESYVMEEVLNYLYTGELQENLDADTLLKILAAAESYQIIKLKNLCASILQKELTVDTAIPILIGSDDSNLPKLLSETLRFISANRANILSLYNFQHLCAKKPQILFKLLALEISK